VMVKLATYIATAPKYVLLARQIFWYAQQEQLLREECHYRDVVYGQKGQGSHHLLYASCQELLKCGCRISCSGNCKCFRSGLPCSYAAVTALNLGLSRPIKPLQPVFWRMCSEHIYEMIL
jgi:hypothetical protein